MPLKLYKRPSGVFHIRGAVQGRHIDQSARTRVRAEAEAIRAKLEADLFRRAVYGDRAVATFAEAVIGYINAGGSGEHLKPLLLKAGNLRLTDIDQAFVDSLAAERRVSPATLVRQIYTPVAAVLNYAATQRLCDPVRFRKPKVDNARIDYLTPAEAEALLAILPAHLRRLVTFYLAAGCRASEALDLKWKDVSPESERAVLWETKAGYPRGVDIQRRARDLLGPRPKDPAQHVFLNSRGKPWHGYDAINLMLGRLIDRHNRDTGASLRHVHCHLFRHTWATWAYAVTKDLTFLMQQGGWRSATMVMRYSHIGSDDLAKAVMDHGWEFFGREWAGRRRSAR